MSVIHNIRAQSKGLVSRFATPELFILLIWPWVLFLVYPNRIYFNAAGLVDTWFYLGYFLNFQSYLDLYSEAQFYYGTRLSWIFPGLIAYQLFPPLLAHLMLRMVVFYTSVLSIYATLTMVVGKRAGLFAGLLLGGYSYFLLASGWDYVDGAAIAYLALTLALLTRASRSHHSWRWMLVAGGAGAAFVTANIFGIVFFPWLGLVFLLINRHHPAVQVRRDLLVGLGGGFSLLGVLGLANLALGGDFLFLSRSFQFASSLVRVESNPWITLVPNWPIQLSYTIWFVLGFLVNGLALILPRTRQLFATQPTGAIFVGLYLMSALTLLGVHQWGSTPVMNAVFYTSYVIVPLFLSVGVLSAPALNQMRAWQVWTLIGTSAGLALVGLQVWTCHVIRTEQIILALIAGMIWIASFVMWPKQPGHLVLLVICLTLITPHAFSNLGAYRTCAVISADPHDPADEYLAVIAANEELQRLVPNRRLTFWYNVEESTVYESVSSVYLYIWNWLGSAFPDLRYQMPQSATVVLLSHQADAPAQARQIMTERGRTFDLIAQRWITQGTVSFGMYVFETTHIPLVVAPGDALDLTSTATTAVRVVSNGWQRPDPTASWTSTATPQLIFNVADPGQADLVMTAEIVDTVRSLSNDPSPVTVTVRLNNTELATWVFDEEEPIGARSVVIPAALQRAEPLVLTLHTATPRLVVEPSQDPGDPRTLGIAIRSLHFSHP